MPPQTSCPDSILARVQKPARYLGNEWNAVCKDHAAVKTSMVLAFSDLYEVGMSNQGLKILYEAVNSSDDLLLERVFAPAVDMETLLRENSLPLFALESGKAIKDFDLVGFSLQYELSYTNILNMLDLGGIALYSVHRNDGDPIVIGGGPSVFNPEPLAPFFDLFLLGEAEEALPALLLDIAEMKERSLDRQTILKELAVREGIYVPALYEPLYLENKLVGMERREKDLPEKICKVVARDLDHAPYPTAPPVPYIQAIHDRAVLEIFRGCGRGCRFCQAGFIYRPVRRRSRDKLVSTAREIIANTGYDEISLSSLSSADYPDLEIVIDELEASLDGSRVRCSLPSLRLDSYSIKLAEKVHQGRRSSLTFAPEAATERLRRIINKNISEEEIFTALGSAVDAGWQGFKLYFMIGLPGEEVSDVEAIVELCRRIRRYFKDRSGRNLKLSVSVSTFVPKAHTPFQWEPQLSLEEIIERQQILRKGFRALPGIDFNWHEAEASLLEAVFARGDRTLAPLLERAWRLGCRFDGWSEYFSFKLWRQVFEELELDAASYACRRYAYDDYLPWDHLYCGVGKDYFIREHQKALCGLSGEGSV